VEVKLKLSHGAMQLF